MAGLEFAGRGRATPADAPRPRSLAETAYDAIEQMIISRRLAPGAMVSEGELGAELGLGRTPVREALARLKTIGFVEVHPRRGVLVTQVDIIKHLELLEVRRPLDETVARCAIARATEADVARLLDCVGGLRSTAEARDREAYFRHKRALHEGLVGAAHNPTLTGTMAALHAQSRRFWYTYEPTASFPDCAAIHAAIVSGIAARDAGTALAGIGTLFDFLDQMTRRALDRRPLV
ncbi:GntR family transcriptional regulator [Methylobacterium radiotolerans]|uniref:GntR family transcriptional regulator n=1 Tax=Methylobacterium TaxID=407 RepID=UPI0005B84369|nr:MULTISPECIES: GntR family transcriptional regulator [Methylobacterium]MBE7245609.1 GntR family transcriptional regulator [Actinomycetospora chiangmaiensis]GAN48620.1 GntR family transcriptional regulator [Methylobacterium sp. ME121]KIU34585.1 GntR family transcriptional regulator [Methylobacterium radiotolerans]KTS08322.1 GntR family transcriptional regulator [Methylobacterium radiotolerans]KTS44747.1 GntR family transcriptional regulator [Methylobacterium radiotolerans]